MNYIVMDLEWNQSSTEKESVKEMPFEIIEIGAIKLNSDREMVGEFSELIKPIVYKSIHKITSNLIHLQMNQLQDGKSFTQVCSSFLDWCGEDYIFCTWGSLDLIELQRNIKYFGLNPLAEGPIRFLDVQKLFSIAFEDKKSRRTLEYAIDFLEIEKDIPFHRAFSDAYYTSKILSKIEESVYKNCSFDLYNPPKAKEDEIHIIFDDYAKYISRCFATKSLAMEDREVVNMKCYLCNKRNKPKIKWFSYNGGKHYLSVSYCDEHGYMKGKIRLKKTQDHQIYVVKTQKFVSEDIVEEVAQKLKKIEEK